MTPTVLQSGIVELQFGRDVKVVLPVNLYGCRIGAGTSVEPFVEIQRGAEIGAGAVVTGDIAKAGVYAGNPAPLLRAPPDSKK